ncbi:MAG: hypothetical protein M3167_01255 [Acidobacteriota bacterium]|nr:hypothetical protein [Acidobacteriota bacterium]
MEPDRPHSSEPGPPPQGDPLSGLKNVRFVSIERVPIRTRESITTRSAWKLQATAEEGEGTISLIEISPTVSLYRGEGVFLGWSSDTLQAAYRSLLPRTEASNFDLPQLG